MYISNKGVQKINKLIRKERREPKNTVPQRNHNTNIDSGFWAVIEGKTTDGGDKGLYKWNRIQAKDKDVIEYMDEQGLDGNFYNSERIVEDITEGDYTDELDNYAVEVLYCSQWVLPKSVVFLRPSISHNYFIFEYNPTIRFVVITTTIPAATIEGTYLKYAEGDAKVINVKEDDDTLAEIGDEITIRNSLRAEIKGTTSKPIIGHITYSEGYWWLTAAECTGKAFE